MSLPAIAWLASQPSTGRRVRPSEPRAASDGNPTANAPRVSRYYTQDNLTMVWDTIPGDVKESLHASSTQSNISPQDYAGSDACVDCHQQNHADWSVHPHRWMNAVADEQTVLGDFDRGAEISYLGGVAKFYRDQGKYKMRFDRHDLHRDYEITQTIGSRFHQYYVGKGVEGPEPREHNYYKVEFVLPFGYWLDRQAWVPIVHVHEELADNERWESVEELKPSASSRTSVSGEVGAARGVIDESVDIALHYARACNYCHTSFPLADMFVRFPKNLGNSIPVKSYFELSDYVAQSHPQIWDGTQPPEQFADAEIQALTGEFIAFDARDQAISLGVGCEACHLGCKAHAQNATSHPAFIPQNPHLLSYTDPDAIDSGRTSENVNAICSRCHAGNRPRYAAGMATWNSTEYTDATRGSCYSELRCTDCHSPHKATGKKWPHSPQHDDDRCLRCHESLREPQRRQRHTHHPAGSTGDHCMNCHMPKINEGMQDVVRTHAIFSPTNPAMIEANQPNACNLCHLDKPIDWTISYLQSWYGRVYAQQMIMQNYPVRAQPVGLGWLKQNHAPTRLVTAQAVADQQATWALPALLQMLDDPYLLNRQFAQVSVERLIGAQLDKRFGYWYYMTEQQRQPIVQSMQKTLGQ